MYARYSKRAKKRSRAVPAHLHIGFFSPTEVFFENPRVKNEGKPKRVPHVPWVDRRNERCPRLSGNRQTDRQTNRQTDRTSTVTLLRMRAEG